MIRKNWIIYSLIGFALWLAGVVFVRIFGVGYLNLGVLHIITFILSGIVAWSSLWAIAALMGQRMADMAVPTMLMAAVALPLDGLVQSFAPWVYGETGLERALLSAWLLWFFACYLAGPLAAMRREHAAS